MAGSTRTSNAAAAVIANEKSRPSITRNNQCPKKKRKEKNLFQLFDSKSTWKFYISPHSLSNNLQEPKNKKKKKEIRRE